MGLRTPHTALLACLLAAAATGCNYGFGMYSKALQKQFSLSHSQLDNINTIPYAFGVTSPCWGMLSKRMGARTSFLLGGTIIGSTQLLMYLVAVKSIPISNPPVTLVAISVVTYFGMCIVTAPSFSTPVLHFQQQRGSATALVKSFVGLSGAVVSQVYVLIFGVPDEDPKALNCLLLWACLSYLFTYTAGFLVPSEPDPEALEPRKVLKVLFWVLVVAGCVTMGVSLAPYGQVHNGLVPVVILLAALPIPIMLCYPIDKPVPELESSAGTFESTSNLTVVQMIQTPEAWFLWWVGSMLIGGGNMLVTQMAQIISSAGAPDSLVPTMVTIFSSCNMLGRLTCMKPSNALVLRGYSRAWFACILCVAMAIGQLLFLVAAHLTSDARHFVFVIGSVMAGLSFGAIWPHLVVLASELFGSQHLSANYMFYDGGCGAFGTMVLANALPNLFYSNDPNSDTCLGSHCYEGTHLCIIGLCASGALASVFIAVRSSQLYEEIMASHSQDAEALVASEQEVNQIDELPKYGQYESDSEKPKRLLKDCSTHGGSTYSVSSMSSVSSKGSWCH